MLMKVEVGRPDGRAGATLDVEIPDETHDVSYQADVAAALRDNEGWVVHAVWKLVQGAPAPIPEPTGEYTAPPFIVPPAD